MNTKEPRVQVKQRVDVSLSVEEVTHALRCWLSHNLVESRAVPAPASFNDIWIAFACDGDGHLLHVTATYEPKAPDHA